MKDNEDNRF